MEQMEEERTALKQTQEAEESVQDGFKKKAEQAMLFLEENELTGDMKEKLIVYAGNRIEIVCRFEKNLFNWIRYKITWSVVKESAFSIDRIFIFKYCCFI